MEASNFNPASPKDGEFDPKCMVDLSKRFVKILYPGIVENVDRAIDTLGGMENIETVVCNPKHMLSLRFHPENLFNKPCFGEKDYSPGILIKVKRKIPKPGSKKKEPIIEYTVVGKTVLNISFNRLCDFQYLPLVAEYPENPSSKVENIYPMIFPDDIPNLNFLERPDAQNMPLFMPPARFGRFDVSLNRMSQKPVEKFGSTVRPEIARLLESSLQKQANTKKGCINIRPYTIYWTFLSNVRQKPPERNLKLLKERGLMEEYNKIVKAFEERPIWTKAAIMWLTNSSQEHAKVLLPAAAAFCKTGPWRMTWIRFGYDPRKDPNSRIYQTLDYRIRAAEGMKLKVELKRKGLSKSTDYVGPLHRQKLTLNDESLRDKSVKLRENSYRITPDLLPPARQMFYQYCDIHLPEVQSMLSRLPPPSLDMKPNSKTGWLPMSFTEQCRELVNNHVLERVRYELTREMQEEKSTAEGQPDADISTKSEYCSNMLSKIRKGIYTSVPFTTVGESSKSLKSNQEVEDLSDERDVEMKDIIERAIPEALSSEESDEDEASDFEESEDSEQELEIDDEILEEINFLASNVK